MQKASLLKNDAYALVYNLSPFQGFATNSLFFYSFPALAGWANDAAPSELWGNIRKTISLFCKQVGKYATVYSNSK